MKPLYTQDEFNNARSRDLLTLECIHCNSPFKRTKNFIQGCNIPRKSGDFCSKRCCALHRGPPVTVACEQCGNSFTKRPSEIKRNKHHFCCLSCGAKWRNAHKTKGTRVSKLERWLAEQLVILFPRLEFHFNRHDAINSELDIFIPSLKLAFELNGIFHYEPIYGTDKLASIQNNDHRKMLACAEQGLELCVLDISSIKYIKPIKMQKFLDIISSLIRSKLVGAKGVVSPASLRVAVPDGVLSIVAEGTGVEPVSEVSHD